MLDKKNYVRRPFEVEAVKVTDENMAEIALWCGGIVVEGAKRKFIKLKSTERPIIRQNQAFAGDFITCSGTNFRSYPGRAFWSTFMDIVEPVPIEMELAVPPES